MHLPPYSAWLLAFTCILRVSTLAPTDSIQDTDTGQSGYLSNHNMDPAVVDSAQFGQLWKKQFNNLEQFFAKPLVYTPNAGGPQLLLLASSQNWIRSLNAKTGDLINARQVATPFLQSDIGCTDIANTIGIIGTPVIDPTTDTMYFYAKTYIPNFRYAGSTGTFNGVYYFYAVNVNTLEDVPGFPILVDGSVSDNAPLKSFVGGIILQRPSLIQIGSVVYAGFGGHCDLFNYTGLVVGVDVNQKQVVTNFAVESGPLAPQTNVWNQDAGGGQGGIWMSGMGLSTDGNRLFWVSGNGVGHENAGTPSSGASGCRTLGEACVNLGVGTGGKLTLNDYFQPYDYQNMDGGDQDFGSGGISLLDPTVFKGTSISRMAITAGKNGKIYILNANNLGGYKMGPGQTDGIVQTIVTNKAVFGGGGSYPLEGGYIYFTPVGFPTYVYKLGFSGSGVPVFSQVGATTETSAGRVGVGVPTVTTNQGKAGTAILWMCDPDAGLRAWYAVPAADGTMKRIKLPQVNGLNKFQRPVFGDARLYVSDATGNVYCLGSPVNIPLNCSSPVDFGAVAFGNSQTEQVTCTALIAINQVTQVITGDLHFQVNLADLPQGAIKAGQTFTFPVVWNLTLANTQNAANASYGNVAPGVKSTALTITTNNALAGYSTSFPISLTGTEVSSKPFLVIAPITVDYGGVVILDPNHVPTNSLPFTISNAGLGNLTILGYAYSIGDSDINYTNVTFANDGSAPLGDGFVAQNLPQIGTVIAGSGQVSVESSFSPTNGTRNYNSFLTFWSTGGKQTIILEGSGSTAPIANFSISTSEGGWLPQGNLNMDFGDVKPGTTPSLQIRICNQGGSVLEISKSKPPNGVFRIDDPTELHESQDIAIGDCAYGTVLFATNVEKPNTPDQFYQNSWTLNTNDLNFGVHVVNITGTIVSQKVGPTNKTNLPVYTYLGCYHDNAPAGRLLSRQAYVGSLNENGLCQNFCYNGTTGPAVFAGTEFQTECYCGNSPPGSTYAVDDSFCTFSCAGDVNQVCGGAGGYLSVYYDSSRYTPSNTSTGPVGGPVTVNQTSNYNYIGCYSDNNPGRALTGLAPAAPAGGNTVDNCATRCTGYEYFGTEYSNECYCGNAIGAGSVLQTSADPTVNGCGMECGGNITEYCGGPNRLNMYQVNGSLPNPTTTSQIPGNSPTATSGPSVVPSASGFSYLGCYTEATNGRALSGLENPVGGSTLTVALCAAACKGYAFMGLEYSGECYCGNTFNAGSAVAPGGSDPQQNMCDMLCDGDQTTYCGGPNRLTAYSYNSSLVSSSSVTSTSQSVTPTVGPIVVPAAGGYTYLGCYTEATNGRALSELQNPISGTSMTVEACAAACNPYKYFGVEYSGECYCGSKFQSGSTLAPGGSDPQLNQCNMLCNGNRTEYCGGPNRLNAYSWDSNSHNGTFSNNTSFNVSSASSLRSATASSSAFPTFANSTATTSGAFSSSGTPFSSATPPPQGPIHVQKAANFVFAGCWNESAAGPTGTRTLNGAVSYDTANMTVEECATSCAGYAWFGIEYYHECYCGQSPNAGSSKVDLGDCNFLCPGNKSEYCGAGNRLDMYSAVTASTIPSTSNMTMLRATPLVASATTSANSLTSSSISTSYASSTISSSSSSISSSLLNTTLTSISNTLTSSSSSSTGTPTVLSNALSSVPSSSSTVNSNPSYTSSISSSTLSPTLTTVSASSTSMSNASSSSASSNSIPSSTITSSSSKSSTASDTSSSSSSTSSSATSSSPLYSPSVGALSSTGWSYLGCANDSTGARSLSGAYTSTSSMTVEACQTYCSSSQANYALAGLEYGSQCFCGNGLQNYGAVGKTGCNKPCAGNSSEICGAAGLMSLYNLTTYVPPTTVKQVDTYLSQGCYNEQKAGRILTGPSYTNATGMTVESCVNFCQANGNNYAGLEYAKQCYCGSALNGATQASNQGSCNMLCTGNNREFCGGSAVLNVYLNTPDSVSGSGTPSTANTNNAAVIQANTTSPGARKRDVGQLEEGSWWRFRSAKNNLV